MRRPKRCAYVAFGRQCKLARTHPPARHQFNDEDCGYPDWRRFLNRVTDDRRPTSETS